MERILWQFLALSIYVFFMGFCFCDFFRLHTVRKLLWFIVLLLIAVYVFHTHGEFDLSLILPFPTLLAIGLGWVEKKDKRLIPKETKKKGFTLLELIVVVIVVGILAMTALPKFVRIAERTRSLEGKLLLAALMSAQFRYYI